MNILELNKINKKYDNQDDFAIKDVSFSLKEGYIMGLIGKNGAGKTSIINMIMNIVKLDSGNINIFKKDHIEYEKEIKDNIGFVYEDSNYYERLSVYEMKNLIAPFYSKWNDDEFNNYLKRFEINGNKKISELSKGMKVKFSLSIALSHNAKLIIMDEPTSGLDPISRREILDILQELIEKDNISVLFSTHITTDLDKIADFITYIDNGQVLFSKSKEELMDEYKIIKAGLTDLDKIDENIIIGINKTNLGFDGLIKSDSLNELKDIDYILETPVIEDLMYYMGRD
ncbi:MAG TPA: ABC transporter ATP-binding protein [Tissierellaceae bacterium]